MTFPPMGDPGSFEIRYPGVLETNLGDEWRARWVDEPELPDDAEVTLVRALIMAEGRGYALRKTGETLWEGIEENLPAGERPEMFVARLARERIGVVASTGTLVGFYACKATRHNPTHAEGAVTLRPLYFVAGRKVKDTPAGSGYERRRMPMNEYGMLMRTRYPEVETHIAEALQRYAVMQAKGGA